MEPNVANQNPDTSQEKQKKNGLRKRIIALAVTCGLIGTIGTGISLAYLTDNESHTNTLTVGNVRINLTEPNWSQTDEFLADGTTAGHDGVPDAAQNVVPNQQVAKDPQITNDGNNDAVVFMRVTVPVKDVTKVANDGTVSAHTAQELFYFEQTDDPIGKQANNFVTSKRNGKDGCWIRLTKKEYIPAEFSAVSTEGQRQYADQRTYVFGYSKAIKKGETTDSLFDKVQVKNILENEVASDQMQNIKVEGWAIQADNIVGSDQNAIVTPGNKNSLSEENLSTIYDIFVKQNGEVDERGDMKYTTYQDKEHGAVEKEADNNNTKNLAGAATVKTTLQASVDRNTISARTNANDTTATPQTAQMTADFVTKAEGLTDETLTYSSSDTSVATVDSTGKITAVGIGDCTITATSVDGAKASVHISVVRDSREVDGQVDTNDAVEEHTGTTEPGSVTPAP